MIKLIIIAILLLCVVGCTKVYKVDLYSGEKVNRIKLGDDMLKKYDNHDLPQRKKIVVDDGVSCYDFAKEDFIACIRTKNCD